MCGALAWEGSGGHDTACRELSWGGCETPDPGRHTRAGLLQMCGALAREGAGGHDTASGELSWGGCETPSPR